MLWERQKRSEVIEKAKEKLDEQMYWLRDMGKWVFVRLEDIIAYSNFADAQFESDMLKAEKSRLTKILTLKSGFVIWGFNDIPQSEGTIYISHQ